MNQYTYLQQLLSGSGGEPSGSSGLLSVALLIVLSLVCIYKPERVHSKGVFRWAILCFFLSIVAPVIAQVILQWMEVPPSGYNSRTNIPELGLAYAMRSALRPCFLGLSILLTIVSIAPRKEFVPIAQRTPEKKHPLDD